MQGPFKVELAIGPSQSEQFHIYDGTGRMVAVCTQRSWADELVARLNRDSRIRPEKNDGTQPHHWR